MLWNYSFFHTFQGLISSIWVIVSNYASNSLNRNILFNWTTSKNDTCGFNVLLWAIQLDLNISPRTRPQPYLRLLLFSHTCHYNSKWTAPCCIPEIFKWKFFLVWVQCIIYENNILRIAENPIVNNCQTGKLITK